MGAASKPSAGFAAAAVVCFVLIDSYFDLKPDASCCLVTCEWELSLSSSINRV